LCDIGFFKFAIARCIVYFENPAVRACYGY